MESGLMDKRAAFMTGLLAGCLFMGIALNALILVAQL